MKTVTSELNWRIVLLAGWLRVGQSKLDKILEQNSAIPRFVLVLPTRARLIPIFERLLKVELYRVDQLTLIALHHHLVPAQVRGREKFESVGHLIELQPVILPDSEDTRVLCVVLPKA